MFKFPLKRHHNNNNGNGSNTNSISNSKSNQSNKKSATSRSNEAFIYIRCGAQNNETNMNNLLNNCNDINNPNNQNHNHILNNYINQINTGKHKDNENAISLGSSNNCSSNSNINNSNNIKNTKSTVQTTWRPQLPLPTEVHLTNEQQHSRNDNINADADIIKYIDSDMERFHRKSKKDSSSLNGSQLSNASHSQSGSKKWSFGRLFRRKKDHESDSTSSLSSEDESDRKAGFSPSHKYGSRNAAAITSTPNMKKSSSKSSATGNRASKLYGAGFDHIVMSPSVATQQQQHHHHHHPDNEFFLPVETMSPANVAQEPFYQNNNGQQLTNPTPPLQHQQQQQAQPQHQQLATSQTALRLHQSQQYLSQADQTQQQQQSVMSRSLYSLDRRAAKVPRPKANTQQQPALPATRSSSEEEELISLNSSTFSKYRSDESIHSSQAHPMSRRSRAARNERYYKRLSRDGEVSNGQVPAMYAPQPQPTTHRWKTQPVPLSIYQGPQQHQQMPQPQTRLRTTNSMEQISPYVQWGQVQQQQQQQQPNPSSYQTSQEQQQPKNLQNSLKENKRSISYDSQIHLQNINGRMHTKPMPPPPPPRDPMRRVNVSGHLQNSSSGDLRPISYAFDQSGLPVVPSGVVSGLSGRCVSDDKIWAQQHSYQALHPLNVQQALNTNSPVNPGRRFITRAERDAHPSKKSLPNGIDFQYMADATPRSRRPIQQINAGDDELPASSGVLRTSKSGLPNSPTKIKNATEFWKKLDEGSSCMDRYLQRSAKDNPMKPRSISSSRVSEMRSYPIPMYSEVCKPKKKSQASPQQPSTDDVDGIVCGSLHIKPSQGNKSNNYVEIRNKDVNKSSSMPHHYQRRSAGANELSLCPPNKYEQYVNEKKEQHHNNPQPHVRKSPAPNPIAAPQLKYPRKKPANLEEAINELEAIYRSLGLTEPEAQDEQKKNLLDDLPPSTDFETFALAHADEYDEEDSPAGEPDPIRDDVAYRSIKLANLQTKAAEKQPPFGIPIGPIVPAPSTDYLHVLPNHAQTLVPHKEKKDPDIVKDDLAVRALRKDPVQTKDKFQYPMGSLVKKNRATRTQSANIYALIQRDAAKPSGGDFHSYLELTKSIDRCGSMSDLHKNESSNDIPSTLKLLQSLKQQEKEQDKQQIHSQCKKSAAHIPFRHPSQGGAIAHLPEMLSGSCHEAAQHRPVPMPRKTLTPEPSNTDTHKMEEALNKIAQEAQESSIKLSHELQELRKEALITCSKPRKSSPEEEKLVQELKEIEKVSQAAKRCGKMLLENLPDNTDSVDGLAAKKNARKLHKEDKLIKAIDQVSEAANMVCEKILKDIVTTEPPVIVHEAVRVKQTHQSAGNAVEMKKETTNKDSALVMPTLIKKLDPAGSQNIEAIARRCMRQLSDLADNHDYDNLSPHEHSTGNETVAMACNIPTLQTSLERNDKTNSNLTEKLAMTRSQMKQQQQQQQVTSPKPKQVIEEIDQIMKECEDQVKTKVKSKKTVIESMAPAVSSATASSFSSSSDCLAKSSSPTASHRFSSSITSFNPYSSSDYLISPSSEFHAPSTDPIKTFSTTSYDVQSTASATPNITTTSNFSCSPSPPPLNLTPVSNCSATLASNASRARSSSPSQYNSTEELAMIFGIEEKAKAKQQASKLQKNSGMKNVSCASSKILLEQDKPKLTPHQLNDDASTCAEVHCTANSPIIRKCCCTNVVPKSNLTNSKCSCILIPNVNPSHNNNNLITNARLCSSSPSSSSYSCVLSASSPSSSSLSSPGSHMSSSRLETIPEFNLDFVEEVDVKLSANFNPLYACKLKIIVDNSHQQEQGQQCKHLDEEQFEEDSDDLTKYDSLNYLEETSSNPDSGNVSLADYPLNNLSDSKSNSIQLNSSCNSRLEIRNCFRTEICIGRENTANISQGQKKFATLATEEEFPPLPTEEELEESLKETSLCIDKEKADFVDKEMAEGILNKKEENRKENESGEENLREKSVLTKQDQQNDLTIEYQVVRANEVIFKEQAEKENELGKGNVREKRELTKQDHQKIHNDFTVNDQEIREMELICKWQEERGNQLRVGYLHESEHVLNEKHQRVLGLGVQIQGESFAEEQLEKIKALPKPIPEKGDNVLSEQIENELPKENPEIGDNELIEQQKESQYLEREQLETELSKANHETGDYGLSEQQEESKYLGRESLNLGERIILARQEIMAEVKALEEKRSDDDTRQFDNDSNDNPTDDDDDDDYRTSEDDEDYDYTSSTDNGTSDEDDYNDYDVSLAENRANTDRRFTILESVRESQLEEIEEEEYEMEQCLEETSTSFITSDNEEDDEVDMENTASNLPPAKPQRKHSIVFETPHLQLNIMEERIYYELISSAKAGDEQKKIAAIRKSSEDLSQQQEELNTDFIDLLDFTETDYQCCSKDLITLEIQEKNVSDGKQDDKKLNNELEYSKVKQHSKEVTKRNQADDIECNMEYTQSESSTLTNSETTELDELVLKGECLNNEKLKPASSESKNVESIRKPEQTSANVNDFRPSTSSKGALTIFGEPRQDEVGGAGAQQANGLNLLEHLAIACTLGVVNTDDILTLILVIIGIIIVIAIALM